MFFVGFFFCNLVNISKYGADYIIFIYFLEPDLMTLLQTLEVKPPSASFWLEWCVCVCVCLGLSWLQAPPAGSTLMAGRWVWQWKAWSILSATCLKLPKHTSSCSWRRFCLRTLGKKPFSGVIRSHSHTATIVTGHLLSLPQVTSVQRHPEEGPESCAS